MALVVKTPPATGGDIRGVGSIPGSGRSPGGGHGNPFQRSCLGNSVDRGAWRAAVHGDAKGHDLATEHQLDGFRGQTQSIHSAELRLAMRLAFLG